MTNEKINEIAVKFNKYLRVAWERYEPPQHLVFAALLTILEVLEENEYEKRMKRIEEALSRRD